MIPFPEKKYNIIYADPPWEYNLFVRSKLTLKNKRKCGCLKYDTMTLDQICDLPVSTITAKDAVLLIWVTFPVLPDVFRIIKSWGFKYTTVAFTWVKRNKSGIGYFAGLGSYTKANAEICILAKKGRGCKVINRKIHQICDLPVSQHSKKPDEIRIRITELFGDLSKIELFARTKIHGWDTWGNDHKLELKPIEFFSDK